MAITRSQTQIKSSYTIEFNATSNTYPLNNYPNSYLKIQIYDPNGNLYHTVNNWTQGVNYPYTFNSKNVGTYSVIYTVYSGNLLDNPDVSPSQSFIVYEYQPTFTLPTVTCAELGKSFTYYPTSWNQNENSLCPTSPLTRQIKYERYEFNINTSSYEKIGNDTIIPIGTTQVPIPGAITNPEAYAYTWTPTKLAMVKIVTTVTNCSFSIEKASVFPVCGAWKIRRLACGNYRIYNYKNSSITYSLYKGVNPTTLLKTETIGAFSYINLPLTEDAIYRVVADNVTQYIFNYCAIENCMLDLQKRILLDDSLCDECKLDKVLYQKALRLLPTYETWKKLLDKDWVYDMQYKSTDVSGELARLYDAEELYSELIKLCEECQSSTKKCNC